MNFKRGKKKQHIHDEGSYCYPKYLKLLEDKGVNRPYSSKKYKKCKYTKKMYHEYRIVEIEDFGGDELRSRLWDKRYFIRIQCKCGKKDWFIVNNLNDISKKKIKNGYLDIGVNDLLENLIKK